MELLETSRQWSYPSTRALLNSVLLLTRSAIQKMTDERSVTKGPPANPRACAALLDDK